MPAKRLRNQDWHRSLEQIHERAGSLDIAVATDCDTDNDQEPNIMWRVRLLELNDDCIIVEQPFALGKAIDIQPGIDMVIILTIGQNRWMFKTKNLAGTTAKEAGGRFGERSTNALRLALPELVERCQRRRNYRVSTTSVVLPDVDIWPLLDPKTVVVAEHANELHFTETQNGNQNNETSEDENSNNSEDIHIPDVGPMFSGKLENLGGGGVGLTVPGDESQSLLRHKLFWMRFSLPPDLKTPICATAKLVHTHMTTSQDYYAGLAFDFTFNPGHQKFVVEQIGRYVANIQRTQMMRKYA